MLLDSQCHISFTDVNYHSGKKFILLVIMWLYLYVHFLSSCLQCLDCAIHSIIYPRRLPWVGCSGVWKWNMTPGVQFYVVLPYDRYKSAYESSREPLSCPYLGNGVRGVCFMSGCVAYRRAKKYNICSRKNESSQGNSADNDMQEARGGKVWE